MTSLPMKTRPPHLRLASLLLAGILSFAFTGCVEPVARYQSAREAFNGAASQENAAKTGSSLPPNVDPNGSGGVTSSLNAPGVRVETGYQASLAILESIDSSGEKTLADRGLLADKLTLQALCLWRLGKDQEFEGVIHRAETAAGREPADAAERSRDSYILQALPGLLMNDQAHRRIPVSLAQPTPNQTTLQELEQLLVGRDESALHYIQPAREAAERNGHPVQDYLVTCELAAYKNLQRAHSAYGQGTSSFRQTPSYGKLKALLSQLKASDRKESKEIAKAWARNFGL